MQLASVQKSSGLKALGLPGPLLPVGRWLSMRPLLGVGPARRAALRRPWLACLAGLVSLVGATAPAEAQGGWAEQRANVYAEYGAQLEELARWCDEQHLTEQARETRSWQPRRDPGTFYLFLLPEGSGPEPPENASPAAAEWFERFQALRRVQSHKLAELSQQAASAREWGPAYELAVEACRENPNDARLRRMLGYQKFRDGWYRPWTARKLRAGHVWHEQYGWIPKGHLPRYAKGQRFFERRWISAEEEARRRAKIDHGWQIATEHYLVTTNISQEAGASLAARLERLQAAWEQLFIGYVASDEELAAMFATGAPLRRVQRQHRVVYFADRQQYRDYLRQVQPQIDMTLGIYFDTLHTAFFFAGEEQDAGTLFHEATHQLFQESRRTAPQIGRRGNFWAVEAAACYMESLVEGPDWVAVGGMAAGRMPAAVQRLLVDGVYVPLEELVAYNVTALQHHPEIARLYSQSAGLAAFFMHFEGGRYRDAWVEYLAAIYSGRDTVASLAQAAGQDYTTLDRQYREFLELAAGGAAPGAGE